MNPFRLINIFELDQFKNHFQAVLDDWNQQYSLHPLTLTLSIPLKEYQSTQNWFIEGSEGDELACISNDFHKMINCSLFGEEDNCFNSCSEELFMALLSQLFNTDSCALNTISQEMNWLYPGSTCLLLNLQCNSSSISMLINPDWVYHNLSLSKKSSQVRIPLEEVLENEQLTFNLELCPMNIPIQQLMELQIGDVIATDHEYALPMQLVYENKSFATTELGKILENKSIIIKEFL